MKRVLIPALFVLALSGCETFKTKPDMPVVTNTVYVIKVPPSDLMTLPPPAKTIDTSKPDLKQSDIAEWVDSTEARMSQLENKLIDIAKYFDEQQNQLDEKAKQENSK